MLGQQYRYGMVQTTPPDVEPIDLAAAKRHLYEDGDHNDADIRDMISDARKWIEDQTETQLCTATWTMTLDRFPRSKWLQLPRWPVRTVESIQYTGTDGEAATVDLSSVVIRKEQGGRGRIARTNWAHWPATKATPDAVNIEFTAGYGDPDEVPTLFKRPMLLLIGHWYEHRQSHQDGKAPEEVQMGVRAIIDSLRPEDDWGGFDLLET